MSRTHLATAILSHPEAGNRTYQDALDLVLQRAKAEAVRRSWPALPPGKRVSIKVHHLPYTGAGTFLDAVLVNDPKAVAP